MKEKELLKLKEKINKAKAEVAELTGRKNYLIQTLTDKWDCSTMQEARKKLEQMEKEIAKLERDIEAKVVKIEEQL